MHVAGGHGMVWASIRDPFLVPGDPLRRQAPRMLGERIKSVKERLEKVKRQRGTQRKARERSGTFRVSLVGYTNAGKSTLFNRLTRAKVAAVDMLFATLDPTMRRVDLPSGRPAILSDTVGFISDLPTDLVAAFHATLEEVEEADLIVHVRDCAHPDSEAQKRDVDQVLDSLRPGLDREGVMIEALNKLDLLSEEEREVVRNLCQRSNGLKVAISALTGEGCPALLEGIDRRIEGERDLCEYRVHLADGRAIAWLYQNGEVRERRDEGEYAHIKVRLAEADQARFDRIRERRQG